MKPDLRYDAISWQGIIFVVYKYTIIQYEIIRRRVSV